MSRVPHRSLVVPLRAAFVWSNYSDLTRPHPKWWFSKGNPLISGKSRLVKYYTGWWLQRFFIFTPIWGRFPTWLIFFSKGLKPPTCIIWPDLWIFTSWNLHHDQRFIDRHLWICCKKCVAQWGGASNPNIDSYLVDVHFACWFLKGGKMTWMVDFYGNSG